jgi:hypothetical protein
LQIVPQRSRLILQFSRLAELRKHRAPGVACDEVAGYAPDRRGPELGEFRIGSQGVAKPIRLAMCTGDTKQGACAHSRIAGGRDPTKRGQRRLVIIVLELEGLAMTEESVWRFCGSRHDGVVQQPAGRIGVNVVGAQDHEQRAVSEGCPFPVRGG